MDVQITDRPALRIGALHHVGPYQDIGSAFALLGAILAEATLPAEDVGGMIAVYHDDPRSTPANELRSEAGIIVPEGVALPGGLEEVRLNGGRYAMTTHIGPYEELPTTWRRFTSEWLPASGHRMGTGPSYEIYLNDPRKTPKTLLETEIYMPLAQ